MTIAVSFELNGALEDHVRALTTDGGEYDSIADYVEALIRRDREEAGELDPETLAMLREAMKEPASEIPPFDPDAFLAELKSSL